MNKLDQASLLLNLRHLNMSDVLDDLQMHCAVGVKSKRKSRGPFVEVFIASPVASEAYDVEVFNEKADQWHIADLQARPMAKL